MNQKITNHKDADTPEELTRWIWDKYVGVPVAGDAWGQEYDHLLDRVRRMDRSSFTKGLHEGADQMKALVSHAPSEAAAQPIDLRDSLEGFPRRHNHKAEIEHNDH